MGSFFDHAFSNNQSFVAGTFLLIGKCSFFFSFTKIVMS